MVYACYLDKIVVIAVVVAAVAADDSDDDNNYVDFYVLYLIEKNQKQGGSHN